VGLKKIATCGKSKKNQGWGEMMTRKPMKKGLSGGGELKFRRGERQKNAPPGPGPEKKKKKKKKKPIYE